LTFAPGVTSLTITVPILNDNTFEPTEAFFVNLSNSTNASIADSQAIATIIDNDPILLTLRQLMVLLLLAMTIQALQEP